MPAPVVPLLIAGGIGLVAWAATRTSSAKVTPTPAPYNPGPGPAPGPGPTPGPNVLPVASDIVVSPWGDRMPAALVQAITLEMQNDKDPNALYRYADALLPDYPGASGQMQTLANALAVDPPVNPPQPVPKPIPVNPQPPQPPPHAEVYDPPLPTPLPAMPKSFSTVKNDAHAQIQRELVRWATQVGYPRYPAVQPNGKRQDDGIIGTGTQKVVAAFQIWANDNRGSGLKVDGIPGTETEDQLDAEFSEDVVVINPVTIVG
jgi:hypothetical protein